jgi:hypothetical protein
MNYRTKFVAGCLFTELCLLWINPACLLAETAISVAGHVRNAQNRPIPGAKVTASGLESYPAITDSFGLYVLSIRSTVGQAVQFRVEKDGYTILSQNAGVNPPIPIDFVLSVNKKVTDGKAISSLRSGLNTIDRVYRQLDCATPPCPTTGKPFLVHLREDLHTTDQVSSLAFVQEDPASSSATVLGTISNTDIARLDDDAKILIIVYEEQVAADYDRWIALSSQLQNGTLQSEDRKAIASQLAVIGRDMCAGLVNMLDVLQGINVNLWDHYASIRNVCYRLDQAHIGN